MNKVINEKKKKFWVHPLNSSHTLKGAFYTLYRDLKADNAMFFNYFQMSYPSYEELVATVQDSLQSEDARKTDV